MMLLLGIRKERLAAVRIAQQADAFCHGRLKQTTVNRVRESLRWEGIAISKELGKQARLAILEADVVATE